ncbi:MULTISPECIES: GNAT family N-acetyltransferase [Pseudanabaena]|uniref:GCN5-related N-acetyltransferase n=2 Tax=Pseudanabaena TaxID=1152 RepID=L8MZF9_9CYAN|nr:MULTISPECIES: GNAT family protein [Pseudanabaena]ELS33352.1 GCN5-related N-acetyltransferase [Pseudanabaena biceps PCC 7429]MDG3494450.1 GNAT family protein [Pseudanabaena catenata USMAC16]
MMNVGRNSLWKGDSIALFVLQPTDVSPNYVSWLNNPVVNCYLESRFSTHTQDSTRKFVESCLVDPTVLFLGIRYLDWRHVGNIKIAVSRHHKLGEVGVLIGEKDVWGKGIASKSISMIMEIAKTELGLRKLTAGCYASNLGSQKAFLKAGFQIECQRKDHFLLNGNPEDMILMASFLR